MSKFITEFKYGTEEYEKLQIMALMLMNRSPNGYRYYVGSTYFDFGQDWKWTTVLCGGDRYGSYQALNPREQEEIILATTYDELVKIAESILSDKYCPDKLEGVAK